jgi:hypothetical protein
MKKRAMIELHFNWIFILIVGAIIFLFFINIINKQRELSEARASGTIITNLESILTGAQISTDTVNIIDMPKVEIGFECNRYFIGQVPKQTKGNVIFSPSLLKGKRIITWALDWNMPYRVTNFLYITDPQLRYIIMGDDGIGGEIFDELPEEMNKELIKSSLDVVDKNNYKVKFVFFDNVDEGVLDEFRKMQDEDVTAIVLKDVSALDLIPNTGTVEFFQKDGAGWKSEGETHYLKKEGLFGAIFAADLETYNCVMKKAFKKLNLVTKVYLERCYNLAEDYGTENTCYLPHIRAKGELDNMESASGEELNDFPDNGIDRMNAMNDYSSNIKSENQKAQLFSCALIY